jgi:hypothetical protein
MALLKSFDTPGYVQDFPNDPKKQEQMNALWSANVNRWVNASLIGDIWDLINYGPRPAFYNPLVTDTPASAVIQPIPWQAFPGRITALFPQSSSSWSEWADTGQIPQMTENLCTGQSISPTAYTPTGPRGWQDEYCEWSVTRDANNKITSVMFTCENPEYWLTLWEVDPDAVLALYQQLVSPSVKLSDLYLVDTSGKPVVDPATGRPAYNPLNIWNRGTQSLAHSGGAVHLTSSPNTLGAEFDLAAAATIPRVDGSGQPVTSAGPLVCCAQYGRAGRHSDPTIGQNVNAIVNSLGLQGARATLTNPPGLYMQTPDFGKLVTPDKTSANQFWKVVRGQLKDPKNPNDIDRILHATFSVPSSLGYTISDITINGQGIQYGSQLVQFIQMRLSATAFASGGANQTGVGCTVQNNTPSVTVSLLQDAQVYAACRDLETQQNEIPFSIPVLSLAVPRGATTGDVALALNTGDTPQDAQVTVEGGGVTVTVTGQTPGGGVPALLVSITVTADAALGDRGVSVTVPNQPSSSQAAIGLLNVVEAEAAPRAVRSAGNLPATPKVTTRGPIKPHFLGGRG